MDKIIETLESALQCLQERMEPSVAKKVIDSLTVLVDNFKDAKKEIETWHLPTHHAEGEPVAHLVEDPPGCEGLPNSPASEENDLPQVLVLDKDTKGTVEPADPNDPEESTFEVDGERFKRVLHVDEDEETEESDDSSDGYDLTEFEPVCGCTHKRAKPGCRKCGNCRRCCDNFYWPYDWPYDHY